MTSPLAPQSVLCPPLSHPTLRLQQNVKHVWPCIETSHDELVRWKVFSVSQGSKTTVPHRCTQMPLNVPTSAAKPPPHGLSFIETTHTRLPRFNRKNCIFRSCAIVIVLSYKYVPDQYIVKQLLSLTLSMPPSGDGILSLPPEAS